MGIIQEDRILFPEEESGTEVKAETRLNSPDLKVCVMASKGRDESCGEREMG